MLELLRIGGPQMLVLSFFALVSMLVVSELFRRAGVARYRAQLATVQAVDRRHHAA